MLSVNLSPNMSGSIINDSKETYFKTDDNQVGEVENIGESPVVLERRFNLLSAIATGIVTGNTWTALGGAIVASLYNGGPPGIIYEFIAVSIFYWLIAASIAELASAIPASGGVYHWAAAVEIRYSLFLVCWVAQFLCLDIWYICQLFHHWPDNCL